MTIDNSTTAPGGLEELPARIAAAVVLSLVSAAVSVANGSLVVVMVRRRKRLAWRVLAFTLHLAVSDLSGGLVLLVVAALNIYTVQIGLSKEAQILLEFELTLSMAGTTLGYLAVFCNQFYAIRYPIKYQVCMCL